MGSYHNRVHTIILQYCILSRRYGVPTYSSITKFKLYSLRSIRLKSVEMLQTLEPFLRTKTVSAIPVIIWKFLQGARVPPLTLHPQFRNPLMTNPSRLSLKPLVGKQMLYSVLTFFLHVWTQALQVP